MEAVLDFWFAGGVTDNVRQRWFAVDGSQAQRDLDAAVTERFAGLLQAATAGELDSWAQSARGAVALIVVLDQFARHVFRGADVPPEASARALALADALAADAGALDALSVEMSLFALLPLRHSGDARRIELAAALCEAREAREQERLDLLGRFRRASTRQLQHASSSSSSSPSQEEDILERPERLDANLTGLPASRLYREVVAFVRGRLDAEREEGVVAVSLSGGVDSMVLAEIAVQARRRGHLPGVARIVAVHIDYANRAESGAEAAFVRRWCEAREVECRVRVISEVTRGVTKRDEYERVSREARYAAYREAMEETGCRAMIFGHHKGDVRENVISNVMKGAGPLALSGMTAESVNSGVRVWRPLLGFDKSAVFEFAHAYGVPYLRDTTPKWSTRGRMRNDLQPLLRDMYGDGYLRQLSALATQSDELNALVQAELFRPFYDRCRVLPLAVSMPARAHAHMPASFWNEVLRGVCHNLMGAAMLSEKAVAQLLERVRRGWDERVWLTARKDTRALLLDDSLLLFREGVFHRTSGAHPDEAREVAVGESVQLGRWRVSLARCPPGPPGPPVTMEDALSGVVVYRLPLLEGVPLLVLPRRQPLPLRGLDKLLTAAMPVVAYESKRLPSLEAGPGVEVRIEFSYSDT